VVSDSDRFSHKPFAHVGQLWKQRRKEQQKQIPKASPSRAAAMASPPLQKTPSFPQSPQTAKKEAALRPHPPPEDELILFRREMKGVCPLSGRENYVGQRAEPPLPREKSDEAEVMAQLADLVAGNVSFDLSSSDEHIEGIAFGLDRRLLKRLRQGYFAVQAHLDLHGKTRQEARDLVETFILDNRLSRRRCVLIVHGRGLNSKDHIPVLKESLKIWLAKGRIARSVLAFCSARATDGGAGAVYVLLRK
jgi:DNA-nicking Smr family endonuclease